MDRRPQHLRAARQDARRLVFDQRPYLQSRPAPGFRHLGAARQSRLGLSGHLPYFKRLEHRVGEGDDTFRGRDGNLTVTTMDWRDPLCEAFMAGAVCLGIPRNPDYNGAIQEGVSYAQRTIKNGLRVSAATAFLHPARKRGNVDVRTHAHATEIIFEGKRAVGVRYRRGGKNGTLHEVRAAKEVILSGGTYNSPQLLQLSGVGSPDCCNRTASKSSHALAWRRRRIAGPLRAAFGRTRQEHQDHQRAPARA